MKIHALWRGFFQEQKEMTLDRVSYDYISQGSFLFTLSI